MQSLDVPGNMMFLPVHIHFTDWLQFIYAIYKDL
jgi:hypothetical protein